MNELQVGDLVRIRQPKYKAGHIRPFVGLLVKLWSLKQYTYAMVQWTGGALSTSHDPNTLERAQ